MKKIHPISWEEENKDLLKNMSEWRKSYICKNNCWEWKKWKFCEHLRKERARVFSTEINNQIKVLMLSNS